MGALFTAGNLITLSISLGAIFIMRYMDRHNRSVDLAREYGKRLKDDIAAFTEEKAALVKDNGLILDVQKSAVKEALNRLTEANAELSDKTSLIMQRVEDIGRIGERISAYDRSMEELIRMTSRVEENINRMNEESALIEVTAKKADEIKDQTLELEKDLDSLALRFERENSALLEKAVSGLVAETEGKVEDLRSEAEAIERLVEEHRARVDHIETEQKIKLEKDLAIINSVLAEAQAKARESANTQEEEALTQYREEAMARAREIQNTIEEKLTEYRTDQDVQWKRFESLADDALKLDSQLRGAMDKAEAKLRSDLALFEEAQKNEQERISAQFINETDNLKKQMEEVEQEFNVLKQRAYDNVSEKLQLLEDDFFTDLAKRSDNIDSRFSEWHSKMEQGLRLLEEEAQAKRRDLENSFKEEINAHIGEQGERILSELERLKLKTDSFEEKIQNTMDMAESRISELSSGADEIRRALKEFSSQTGLFEKAEEMKTSLDRNMETLKADLSGIEEKRAEAARLETELIKIRRLEDEVNAKMTRFLSEKSHLDFIEKNFERLIQTSQKVEERLKEVTGADDILQNVQVSVRRLEDAIAAAEDKFQRVENKNRILEETNRSIERNFEMLEEAELALRKCRENIDKAEEELDSLRPSIENLALASEKAYDAHEKLETLDTNLSAIEERIDKMQVAREWLARTETRFEELNKEAHGELKMLETVLKDQAKKSGPSKGAPPPSIRDAVIRLFRRGWGYEEIARNLKISRGEVELIVETGTKEQ